MKNSIKPFLALRNKLQKEYGINEIPYYVLSQLGDHFPVRSITSNGVQYLNGTTDQQFKECLDKLHYALDGGWFVRFQWDGIWREVIFASLGGSRFTKGCFYDSDDYTWLHIVCDPADDRFYAYCNFLIGSVDEAKNKTEQRMTNIEITEIVL